MEISLKEIIDLTSNKQVSSDDSHWNIGANYLIRTVTMIQVGKLEKVTDKELVLSNAHWIADTGKFSDSLKTGIFEEVESFRSEKNVIVGRGALVDAQEIDVDLNNIKTK